MIFSPYPKIKGLILEKKGKEGEIEGMEEERKIKEIDV